jgi:hypothetical protein
MAYVYKIRAVCASETTRNMQKVCHLHRTVFLLTPCRQNPKVHHRIHKSSPTISIPRQVNPLHTPPPLNQSP